MLKEIVSQHAGEASIPGEKYIPSPKGFISASYLGKCPKARALEKKKVEPTTPVSEPWVETFRGRMTLAFGSWAESMVKTALMKAGVCTEFGVEHRDDARRIFGRVDAVYVDDFLGTRYAVEIKARANIYGGIEPRATDVMQLYAYMAGGEYDEGILLIVTTNDIEEYFVTVNEGVVQLLNSDGIHIRDMFTVNQFEEHVKSFTRLLDIESAEELLAVPAPVTDPLNDAGSDPLITGYNMCAEIPVKPKNTKSRGKEFGRAVSACPWQCHEELLSPASVVLTDEKVIKFA